jgi:hypothetical protein
MRYVAIKSGQKAKAALGLGYLVLAVLGAILPAFALQNPDESCWKCHAGAPTLNRQLFETSAHRELDCQVCHTDITETPHEDALAPVSAHVCAACHAPIVQEYQQSVHGRARTQGIGEAAHCSDCHTAHEILAKSNPASSVSFKNLPRTCGRCHESAELADRFGLPSHRYTTYIDSYHGLTLEYGNLVAANCSSCHGRHLILAASDPGSSIHSAGLAKTCGQCHPNASENFLKGRVHVEANPEVSMGVYAVRLFYMFFIGVLGIFFLLHITLDLFRWLKRRQHA